MTFTGKKDTVGSINMSKVSLFGGQLVKGEASKFRRQEEGKMEKENIWAYRVNLTYRKCEWYGRHHAMRGFRFTYLFYLFLT